MINHLISIVLSLLITLGVLHFIEVQLTRRYRHKAIPFIFRCLKQSTGLAALDTIAIYPPRIHSAVISIVLILLFFALTRLVRSLIEVKLEPNNILTTTLREVASDWEICANLAFVDLAINYLYSSVLLINIAEIIGAFAIHQVASIFRKLYFRDRAKYEQQASQSEIDIKVKLTFISFCDSIAKYAITFLFVVYVLYVFGINLVLLMSSSTVLLAVLGLAWQKALEDFVYGLFIVFDSELGVGDTIGIKGQYGKITKISLRATTILRSDGSMCLIPNRLLGSEVIRISGQT